MKSGGRRVLSKVSREGHCRGGNTNQNACRNNAGVMRHVSAFMQGPHTGVMHRYNAAAHDNWRGNESKVRAPPKRYCLKSNADD